MLIVTCRDFVELLGDYRAGALDAASKALFERHHTHCRACRDYLRSYDRTVLLARTVAGNEPVPNVPEELVRTILAHVRA